MTASRRMITALAAVLCLLSASALAQTDDAAKILGQANGGTIAIVVYGADKAEVAKGSAMTVAEDILATAYHVISQAYDVEVITFKGKKVKVEGIIGLDKAHDVALLKLKGKAQPLNVSVAGREALAGGTKIFAAGANESGQIIISEGTFRRFVDVGPQEKVMEVALSTPSQFSGGPVFDISGQVVGMTLVLAPSVKVVLPVDVVQKVSRTGKVSDFKSWTREKYGDIFEGASFVGRVAAGVDEFSTARLNLENASSQNQAFKEGFRLLAGIYERQRDYQSAIGAYQKLTAQDGAGPEAFYGLGRVLKRTSKFQEAAEAFEKAIALNIDSQDIQFDLGETYEAMQNWTKAADAYEKFLALKPAAAWKGQARLGVCRMKLEQYGPAVAAFLAAREAQPKDRDISARLAEAYEKTGQLDKAEEVYNNLAATFPSDAKTFYTAAIRMYDAANKYDLAVGPAKRIVDLEPKNDLNVYNLGLMYFKLQKYDDAVAAFRQSLAISPSGNNAPNAWFQIGSAYFQQKKYKEAVDAYKKYTAFSPEEPNGWLSLGVSYMYLKDFEGALEPMRKCVELRPENASAQFNLGIVYINLKDNLSAREVYKKLATLDQGLAEKLKRYIRP